MPAVDVFSYLLGAGTVLLLFVVGRLVRRARRAAHARGQERERRRTAQLRAQRHAESKARVRFISDDQSGDGH